jgi:hypothetical protein
MAVERRHVQLVMQPGVMEKLRLTSECMAEGAELLRKAHALLCELRDSEALVVSGNGILVEGDLGAADLADMTQAGK